MKNAFCQAYCFDFQSNQNSFFCQSIKILSDFWFGEVTLKNGQTLKKWTIDAHSVAILKDGGIFACQKMRKKR